MEFLKKAKLNAQIAFNSLFRGMKAADDVMLKQTHGGGEVEVVQEKGGSGVLNDMLQGKVTQEVEEVMRVIAFSKRQGTIR